MLKEEKVGYPRSRQTSDAPRRVHFYVGKNAGRKIKLFERRNFTPANYAQELTNTGFAPARQQKATLRALLQRQNPDGTSSKQYTCKQTTGTHVWFNDDDDDTGKRKAAAALLCTVLLFPPEAKQQEFHPKPKQHETLLYVQEPSTSSRATS